MATSKKNPRSSTKKKKKAEVGKKSGVKGRLAPGKQKRGLDADAINLGLDQPEVAQLANEVRSAGGAVIGAYREPLSGRPMVFAALPLTAIQPTPFQRDLSPTHTRRLAQKIEQSGAFLDPLIVVRGEDGKLWTPNGRHRLAAAKVLGLRQVTALVSPDEKLAYCILTLNTEKAHNLKDRSLEVIRMAQNLVQRQPRAKESQFAAEFEAAELITLGIIYQQNKQFAGGAYSPLLKKLDRLSDRTLAVSLRQRRDYAARLQEIDAQVKRIMDGLQKRGFKSPYLRNYVVARINPVRFYRAKKGDTTPPMAMAAALTRIASAAKQFDLDSVTSHDLALVTTLATAQ